MRFGTTYYQLLDPDFRNVAAVYRLNYLPTSLTIERYDPAAGEWTEGPPSFLRYVNEGEIGADEIEQAEAERLIAVGLPALPSLQ